MCSHVVFSHTSSPSSHLLSVEERHPVRQKEVKHDGLAGRNLSDCALGATYAVKLTVLFLFCLALCRLDSQWTSMHVCRRTQFGQTSLHSLFFAMRCT